MHVETDHDAMAVFAESMVSQKEKETEKTRRDAWQEKRKMKFLKHRRLSESGKQKTDEMTKGHTDVKKWECDYLNMKCVHSKSLRGPPRVDRPTRGAPRAPSPLPSAPPPRPGSRLSHPSSAAETPAGLGQDKRP